MNERRRYNPLVIDPDDYDKLFDEDYLDGGEDAENSKEFEHISDGVRRRKPAFESDL